MTANVGYLAYSHFEYEMPGLAISINYLPSTPSAIERPAPGADCMLRS